METSQLTPVKFTQGALNEIQRLMGESGFDRNQLLRIGVKGGGCSGMSYVLGFDLPNDKDTLYETGGIKMIIEKAHEIYLAGMEIDFQNEIGRASCRERV